MDDLLQLASDQLPAISIGVATLAASAGAAYYLRNRTTPVETVVPLNDQSVIVGDDPSCRASRLSPKGEFLEYFYDDCRTLYQVFHRGMRVSKNGACVGRRPPGSSTYEWTSYSDTIKQAQQLGSALVKLGCEPGNKTCIGIFSKNRPEWIITEIACFTYSMILVPVYETLGVDACAHVIQQAEISTVVCDKNEQALVLLKLAAKTPVLRRVIMMEAPSDEVKTQSHALGIEVVPFEEALKIGRKNLLDPQPPAPEDVAVICYTSGTTGTPKGVVLTHYNVMAAVCATMQQISMKVGPQLGDSMCSFLPLCHMLEFCCEHAMYMEGAQVGFYSGDIRKINEDIKALKPTCLVVVPRLLNRIYSAVTGKVKGSWAKQTMLNLASYFKDQDLNSGIISRNTLWDRLVFKKVQEQMGGNLRFMVVASAPLSPSVLKFCRMAFGCSIMEGYGQTEAVAPITLTIHGDVKSEDGDGNTGVHVGPPVPCCMVKLCDVPEMDLKVSRDRAGEICIKGANVFQGYYKEPEKTREVLDEDGWLHSGDIGLWTENGCLRIIDRKKHIFKLSQGEYIAPEKIESVYQKNPLVGQVFIHGDSLKSCLVGIVVPDEDSLKRWGAHEGLEDDSFKELCRNPKAKNMMLKELTAEGKAAGLHSFEQVKDILLHPEPFSVENEMLTPTLKTKRNEIKKSFAKQLADMYSHLD